MSLGRAAKRAGRAWGKVLRGGEDVLWRESRFSEWQALPDLEETGGLETVPAFDVATRDLYLEAVFRGVRAEG